MAYIPNEWKDQVVQRPKTYQINNNDDGSVTLIDSFGLVTELGTPVNQDYMNHIEQGIAGCAIRYYSTAETFNANEVVLNATEDGEVKFWKSLLDNNKNNPLTDETKWQEISLGGGSGLEICDIGTSLYIDESKGLRRWLNGQVVAMNANTQAFLTRLKQIKATSPSLFTTEENWQAEKLLSAYGQVGKFVIADDESTVRLPAVINIQGLFDLQNLGMTVKAGLPNITGVSNFAADIAGNYLGAMKVNSTTREGYSRQYTGTMTAGISFDASLSNSIYGNSDTVQPEAVQYPYFIQIATGQETKAEIINELELNNPYTLFDCKYSETKLYNIAWLRSEGQWNSKAVYVKAYEALLVEQNAEVADGTTVELPSGTSYTKRGLPVKLSTEDYTDYDFVLNTSDESFRLQIKSKLAGSKFVKGNGMALGITDGVNNFGLSCNDFESAGTTFNGKTGAYGESIGSGSTGGSGLSFDTRYGITTDSSKSGIELDDTNLYLYYYVGETIQNPSIINAGRIEEKLADCLTRGNKEEITGWGFPSDRYDVLGTPTDDQAFIAPADGWYWFLGRWDNQNGYFQMRNIEDLYRVQVPAVTIVGFWGLLLPIKKGKTCRINYAVTPTDVSFYFYYAEGAK